MGNFEPYLSEKGTERNLDCPYAGPQADLIEAPAGSIVLYDARTWHRAGMNFTTNRRGAIIQAIVPSFIVPFMDTSKHLQGISR